ncbi:hypothetical protein QBC35DRAFT_385090 [Podospora australis]|uniref:Roadblock/LAMTOR2 domain-containing protein n=1 Tax=Podospora australis TaxID=1536484 RepID=A0AAN6WST0_9PEZI|nr:hypothetical protein QBC35DRAFT_385090 [Podospora australis]
MFNDLQLSDALDDQLSRIAQKKGVKAAFAIDKATGALLKSSGQLSLVRSTHSNGAASLPSQTVGSFTSETVTQATPSPDQTADELSALVWNYVTATDSFVGELDSEDEVKLLRLRTKHQELVIVPDKKYILVVAHEVHGN